MKRRKNILKNAGVLLIVVVMVLSTIAVTANTVENGQTEKMINEPYVCVQPAMNSPGDCPDGMISYWTLDETVAGTVVDCYGSNDGTNNGATINQPGQVNRAYSFDGVDDHVKVAHSSSLNPTSAYTIEAWVYATDLTTTGENTIVAKNLEQQGVIPYCFVYTAREVFGDGRNGFGIGYYPGSWYGVASGEPVNLNTWYYVVGTYDGSEFRIYVNGVLKQTVAFAMAIPSNTASVGIGKYSSTYPMMWNGLIDEVAIYNRALSSTEISYHYNKGLAGYGYCAIWSEEAKLVASDGANFGKSVSVDGDYAIIGDDKDDDNGPESGAAYIFKRSGSTWSQQAKLIASDGAMADWFGRSVSIDGEYAIIGAPRDDSSTGSAYIFKRDGTTWSQQAKLTASDGVPGNVFGYSVSIDEDRAIIGANGYTVIKGGTGKYDVYIFKRTGTTWSQEAILSKTAGSFAETYVSISGDYIIIGAHNDDNKGAAYVFKRSGTTWSQQAKLTANDGVNGDLFGCSVSVSINGEYAIVGAFRKDQYTGAAYIFKRSGTTWSQQAKLTPKDPQLFDSFGYCVSIDGDYYVVVGAYEKNSYQGSAYVFKRDGNSWTQEAKLFPLGTGSNDQLGYSVSISGNYVLTGAPYHWEGGIGGAVYVFKRYNQPPNAPNITGPTSGKVGTSYNFIFNVVDSDGDDVRFIIEWGDTTSDTTIYGASGDDVTVSHTWTAEGTFTIKAKAEDEFGQIGPETTKTVTMPRDKAINRPLLQFLQSHPNLFPILQMLLQRLGL